MVGAGPAFSQFRENGSSRLEGMEIINRMPAATGDFASQGSYARIQRKIAQDVQWSFTADEYPMRRITQAEVKRRFAICFESYRQLRNEYKWGLVRSLDHMYPLLKVALDGRVCRFDTTRSSWHGPAST